MRIEILVIAVTAFLIYNAYHDNKYTKMLLSYKKYYKMIFYALIGVALYVLMKRNPEQGRNLLLYANNMVRFMPVSKQSVDMMSPIFDMTNSNGYETDGRSFMQQMNGVNPTFLGAAAMGGGQRKPNGATKRSVSETKKKYVAAQQNWICGHCQNQLDHTYEIDHRVRLEYGGSNEVDNLVALCRNCHGRKTASENM